MNNEKPNYGNWIRKRRLTIIFAFGVALLLVSFAPLPGVAQTALWILGMLILLGFSYQLYVYAQFAEWGGDLQTRLRDATLDKLEWEGRGQALDIGTGNGPVVVSLAKRQEEATFIGVDSWEGDWEYSQDQCVRNAELEGVGNRVRFERASASSLPYDDGTFDAAVSHFVFHEVADVEDKRDLLKEAVRIVKEGGSFSFHDMFKDERIYGDLDELLAIVKTWGVKEVEFTDTRDMVSIPPLLGGRRAPGNVGIIHGKK